MYSNQTLSEEAVDLSMIEVAIQQFIILLLFSFQPYMTKYADHSKHGIMDKHFQDVSEALST